MIVNRTLVQTWIALVLIADLSVGLAAAPVIGVITAGGAFQVDRSPLTGSATIFEGNRIETQTASSQIHLKNGARLGLAPASSGIVYADRMVL
jgi:hypothetical protein